MDPAVPSVVVNLPESSIWTSPAIGGLLALLGALGGVLLTQRGQRDLARDTQASQLRLEREKHARERRAARATPLRRIVGERIVMLLELERAMTSAGDSDPEEVKRTAEAILTPNDVLKRPELLGIMSTPLEEPFTRYFHAEGRVLVQLIRAMALKDFQNPDFQDAVKEMEASARQIDIAIERYIDGE